MRTLRSITTITACAGFAGSAFVAFASCSSTQSPVENAPLVDSATTRPDVKADAELEDARVDASDARVDASDARSDASDATPPPPPACASLPMMVCNFDGTCPAFAGIGAGGTGQPNFAADSGLDGSTALRAYVPDGGIALFGMPFQDPNPNGPTAPIVGCRVVCDANLRFESGRSSPVDVVIGNEGDTFRLRAEDGGWFHSAPDASTSAHDAATSSDWMHVTVRLTPLDAGASSEITLVQSNDASTTTVPISMVGQQMRFGAIVSTATTEPVIVYVDDIVCRVFE